MGNRATVVQYLFLIHICWLIKNLPSEVSNLRMYGDKEGAVYMSIGTDHKLHFSRGIIRLTSDGQIWVIGGYRVPGQSDRVTWAVELRGV